MVWVVGTAIRATSAGKSAGSAAATVAAAAERDLVAGDLQLGQPAAVRAATVANCTLSASTSTTPAASGR